LPLTRSGHETGNRSKLVSATPKAGFSLGIPPESNVFCFTVPDTRYLDTRPEHQKGNSYKYKWDSPKVFLNAVTKSRRGWRIAAFADQQGLVGYQNITGIWTSGYDLIALAAVLNGPLANAFVATREGKRHITIDTLKSIPVPRFSTGQLSKLHLHVEEYLRGLASWDGALRDNLRSRELEVLLKTIDAVVLEAYDLPPRMERQLLDFFNDQKRAVPFEFGNYFPAGFEPALTLAEWLTGRPALATVGRFRSQTRELPSHIMNAVTGAGDSND